MVDSSPHLLLVEDDPVVAGMIVDVLTAQGMRVDHVATLAAAQAAMALPPPPTLLLLDYLLPDGTARNFLDVLSDETRLGTSFIVMTGCGDEQLAVEMMKRGARDYLVKDQRLLDALPLVVQKALRDHRLEAELRETRRRLQQNEAVLRSTFDQAAVGMVFFGLDGELLRFNRRYAEIVGYSGEELRSLRFQDVTHPEDVGQQIDQIRLLLQGKTSTCTLEKRYRQRDGRLNWASLTISLVCAEDGEPSHYFAVVEEISDVKELVARLQEKEHHLLLAQELAKAASFEWDLESDEMTWTPQGYVLLERQPGTFAQTMRTWFDFVHPEDRLRLQGVIEARLRGEPINSVEYRLLMPDGRIKHVVSKGDVFSAKEGVPPKLVGVTLDLTDRFEYESRLEEARQRAESANRAKSEFLANMSHEIRTPLNGILGVLQLLEGSALEAEQREYVGIAQQTAWSLLQLLNDLLDLSRIEAGGMTLRQDTFALRELVENTLLLFRTSASEKGLSLQGSVAPDLPGHLRGDASRIRQILFNLLGNAVKFTTSGEVRVELDRQGEDEFGNLMLRIRVLDTGIGISEALLSKVFVPFIQGEGSYQRATQGAGLGLSIVKRLAELMGGTAEIARRPQGGVEVTVVIRVGLGGDEVPLAAESRLPALSGAPPLQILLTEDNPVNRLLMTRMLLQLGHRVEAVEDGRQALAALALRRYDLVLMDIQMPELDGVETTRLIRSGTSNVLDPQVPILAVTAYAHPEEQQSFLAAGINRCLIKPVHMLDLAAVLAHFPSAVAGSD